LAAKRSAFAFSIMLRNHSTGSLGVFENHVAVFYPPCSSIISLVGLPSLDEIADMNV